MRNKPEIPATHKGVRLWLLLWKATKALEAHARRSVEATGLCLSDFGVLEALLHKGPLPVNELGKKILVSSGSVTAAVDRLERAGFVQRRDTPVDRRSRIVHLTATGSALIRRLFQEHEHDMEQAFGALDRPEREAFASLLRKLGEKPDGHGAKEVKATEKRKRN